MKLEFAFTVALIASMDVANAQCKLHTKTDDFDGSVTSWTDQVRIASDGMPGILKGPGYVECSFKIFVNLVSAKGKVVLAITERSKLCDCATTALLLKFADGKVLTKESPRSGQSKTISAWETEQYSYFVLTKDELALLASQKIVKFRLKASGCSEHPVIEDEMSKRDAEKIQESANCILQLKN
ncbi:hypothetical protein GCM10023093_07410 [Nemorincola caseinilytica]|uniref:Secreted protein n=1 Tax=Nemorincola caseinilytica TaxID=2054315 RepID=A0ABP8N7S4_9BACT